MRDGMRAPGERGEMRSQAPGMQEWWPRMRGERRLMPLLLLGRVRVPGRPGMQWCWPCCWYRPVMTRMEAAPTRRLLLLVAGGKLLRMLLLPRLLLLQVGGVLLG